MGRKKKKQLAKNERYRNKLAKRYLKRSYRMAKQAQRSRDNAKRISKMTDIEYIKKDTGYNINTNSGMKKFKDWYGNSDHNSTSNIKKFRQQGISSEKARADSAQKAANAYKRYSEKISNMKISDFNTKKKKSVIM